VFPRLREWCEQRRLRLVDVDLRWGVTEADATNNKRVVDVCRAASTIAGPSSSVCSASAMLDPEAAGRGSRDQRRVPTYCRRPGCGVSTVRAWDLDTGACLGIWCGVDGFLA